MKYSLKDTISMNSHPITARRQCCARLCHATLSISFILSKPVLTYTQDHHISKAMTKGNNHNCIQALNPPYMHISCPSLHFLLWLQLRLKCDKTYWECTWIGIGTTPGLQTVETKTDINKFALKDVSRPHQNLKHQHYWECCHSVVLWQCGTMAFPFSCKS